MPDKATIIHLRLPADTAERLRILAEHDERPMAWHIRKALDAYLKEKQA